jgi:putative ABC transport system permease protein
VLVAAVPGGLPVFGEIGLDPRVLAFAAAITIGAGLLFGAAPALHAVRADLHDALKARGADTPSRRRFETRSVLVAAELALCIVLLVGAGLLTRSLDALTRVDTGVEAKGLLTAEFRLPAAKYTNDTLINDFMDHALTAIRAVPGVTSAALVMAIPFSGNFGSTNYLTDAHPDAPQGQEPAAQQNSASDGMFSTFGIRMIEGRDFERTDGLGAPMVAIVNEALAKKEWPGQSAIGHRVKIVGPPDTWVTVVGVVGNVKQLTLNEPVEPQIYQPKAQAPAIFSSIVVRTEGDPMALAPGVRAALWSVDRDQPIWKMRTLESLIERDVAPPKFTMMLTGAFAMLAMVLAAIGVYGVMSYAVEQRTREVGIRMALGARRGEVVRLVLGRGMMIVLVATVVGLAAAFAAARLIRGQLFGITASDPVTFAGVPVVLAVVALLACYLPARRASRVDPAIALRSD